MTTSRSRDSLKCFEALTVRDRAYTYYSLKAAERTLGDLSHLPCCIRVLLENLLRHEDDILVTVEDMRTLSAFHALRKNIPTLPFWPARILMHDEAAVSTLTDLAALRDAVVERKEDPAIVASACPVDIVVDHTTTPYAENRERFALLQWGAQTIPNVRVIPPGHGISNQVNIDALTEVIRTNLAPGSPAALIIPDTVLGADRRLMMVNSLGVLGWHTSVLDLEGVILGQPITIKIPGVLGVKLTGKIRKNTGISDIALSLVRTLAQNNAEGKIVEFYGPALDHFSTADRAVIASFVQECGALCAFFPIDHTTIKHLSDTGNSPHHIELVEAYARAQGLWRESWPHDAKQDPSFTAQIEVPLDSIRPALGGPNKVTQLVPLVDAAEAFERDFPAPSAAVSPLDPVKHGDVVLASISSCGSSAHPMEMAIAGLVARKARAAGLSVRPWVRTVLSVASPVMTGFLTNSGLKTDLEALGFHLTGKDCANCLNCAALQDSIATTIEKENLTVCAVTSGMRDTEESLHPLCKASYVTSPVLVVAYAIAGTMTLDLAGKPLGTSSTGKPIALKDLLPTAAELEAVFEGVSFVDLHKSFKASLQEAPAEWTEVQPDPAPLFSWNEKSTLIRRPPFFKDIALQKPKLRNVSKAHILAIYGDDIRAKQIAPDGPIRLNSPASHYLATFNMLPENLGSFGNRSGNYEVMIRGAMVKPGLINRMTPDSPPGVTRHVPSGALIAISDAAERYRRENVPMILVAGKNFGTGPEQEWAVKSLRLLGIQTVLAESFDPALRLNLIRIGILPLQLKHGITLADLKLTGDETISLAGISDIEHPPAEAMVTIERADGVDRYMMLCRLETDEEIEELRHGGLLAASLRDLIPLAV